MPKKLRTDFPVNSKVVSRECLYCHSTFFSNKPFTKYCSDKCRVYYHSAGKKSMAGLISSVTPVMSEDEIEFLYNKRPTPQDLTELSEFIQIEKIKTASPPNRPHTDRLVDILDSFCNTVEEMPLIALKSFWEELMLEHQSADVLENRLEPNYSDIAKIANWRGYGVGRSGFVWKRKK